MEAGQRSERWQTPTRRRRELLLPTGIELGNWNGKRWAEGSLLAYAPFLVQIAFGRPGVGTIKPLALNRVCAKGNFFMLALLEDEEDCEQQMSQFPACQLGRGS